MTLNWTSRSIDTCQRKESNSWFFSSTQFSTKRGSEHCKVMVKWCSVYIYIYNDAPNLLSFTTFNLSNWQNAVRRHQGWTLTICWRCCFLRRYFQLLLAFVRRRLAEKNVKQKKTGVPMLPWEWWYLVPLPLPSLIIVLEISPWIRGRKQWLETPWVVCKLYFAVRLCVCYLFVCRRLLVLPWNLIEVELGKAW